MTKLFKFPKARKPTAPGFKRCGTDTWMHTMYFYRDDKLKYGAMAQEMSIGNMAGLIYTLLEREYRRRYKRKGDTNAALKKISALILGVAQRKSIEEQAGYTGPRMPDGGRELEVYKCEKHHKMKWRFKRKPGDPKLTLPLMRCEKCDSTHFRRHDIVSGDGQNQRMLYCMACGKTRKVWKVKGDKPRAKRNSLPRANTAARR